MKKNLIFCLFTAVVVFFLFTIQVFAKTEENVISKIIIDSPTKNNFSLNLLFNEEYKGSAFIHKIENGYYYVFLPETITKGKSPKIIFKNKSDKSKINLKIEEKPFIKDKKTTNYTRIAVNMADDYSLKLISGLASDYKAGFLQTTGINWGSIVILAFLCLAVYLVAKIFKQCKSNETNNYRYSRTYADLKAQTEYIEEMKRKSDNNVEREIRNRNIAKNKLRQADKTSFDCFELPYVEDLNTSKDFEIKSTLNQASKLLKEKPSLVKLRHTNPILKSNSMNVSGLQIPAAEDIIKKNRIQTRVEEPEKPANAELLSVLNITPNKGFYLTTVEDTLALFGFINESVFLFQKFNDLSQINLQARYYDKNGQNDVYIVRLDDYKAMIEISDTSMRELAKI